MKFTIEESSITTVTIVEHVSLYRNRKTEEFSGEDLVRLLKHCPTAKVVRSEDHPEFKLLRDQLEQEGYIQCQRTYWNGDTVLKPFQLNEWNFEVGDRFLSAGALKVSITHARHNGEKKLLLL